MTARLLPAVSAATLALVIWAAPAFAVPAPTWLQPTVVTPSGEAASGDGLLVGVTPEGRVLAAWTASADGHVFVRGRVRALDGTWSDAVDLTSSDYNVGDPKLVSTPDGDIVVSWTENRATSTVLVRRWKHDADGWADAEIVSNPDSSAGNSSLAVDGASNVTISYRQNDGGHERVAVRRLPNDSDTWSVPEFVSPAEEWVADTAVTSAPNGDLTIIWGQMDSGVRRVRAAHQRSGGSWVLAPAALSEDAPLVGQFVLMSYPNGDSQAVWVEAQSDGSDMSTHAATRSDDTDIWITHDDLFSAGAFAPSGAITPQGDAVIASIDMSVGLTAYATARTAGSSDWAEAIAPFGTGDANGIASMTARSDGSVYGAALRGADFGSLAPAVAGRDRSTGTWVTASPFTDESAYPNASISIGSDSAGDLAMIWQRPDGKVVLGAGDAAPPEISEVSVPASAKVGQSVSLSASATDLWSDVSSVSWDFGDGTTASGETSAHAFTAAGTFSVTVTATDAAGHSATSEPQAVTIAPVPSPPAPPVEKPPVVRPPVVRPPVVKPPVVEAPAIEALLAGKRVAIAVKLKLKHGKSCKGTAIATTAYGSRKYRTSLKLKKQGKDCVATGTIRLKKSPSLRTKLRVKISTKSASIRTVTTKRG